MPLRNLLHPMKGILFIFLIISLSACKEDEEVTPVKKPASEFTDINNWIYDVMDEVYLWTDDMPSKPGLDLEPNEFFDKLLSTQDRFSVIVPDYEDLLNSLSGVTEEAGYEFTLARASETNEDVLAIVLYVKNGSPAANTDIMRGDIITHVNGVKMTLSNYQSLMEDMESSHSVTYMRYNENIKKFEPAGDITMNTVVLAENPNHLSKIITSQTGKKVGYYVYNFFSPGPNDGSASYDEEMISIINDFKTQGVDEIVLDLRYNSGGALSSAVVLASLLGKGVDNSKIFSENRWNALYQNYIEGRSDGDEILRRRFINLSENIGNQLGSSKIYVLTGQNTASASELVINGLLPYMDVHIIGEQTVGKNVGSVALEDEENAQNNYGLLPIVFQIYNSAGESNYSQGFLPMAEDQVVDLQIPMLPLGDPEEPLLARALNIIDGAVGRMELEGREQRATQALEPLGSSIQKKMRSNRLILDK